MYPFDLNVPLRLRINEIQSSEFVYLKLRTGLCSTDSSINNIFDSLTNKTDRLFFSIDNLARFPHIQEYETGYPIAWFGVPVPVGSSQHGVKDEYTVYSNIDPVSLNTFETQKLKFINQDKVIPEFSLSGNHYQLGPTIVEFFERYKLPFAFIKIEGVPDKERVQQFRETFETLRIKGFKGKIYFSFNNPHLEEWNLKTYNTFSGAQAVHVDLSNKCTHSCVFCGLWGPEFINQIKSQADGTAFNGDVFMNRQMPYQKVVEILEALPETVQAVQFGGAGDPLTHPQWLEILSLWISRGLKVEVLTNFEYPSFHELETLHNLSRGIRKIEFMVNVSAATADVYKIIRPRQPKSTFDKVIANIRYLRNLVTRDGDGAIFTMIHVINRHNFHEAVKMVELAHELGVGVWLKPLEVHSNTHKNFSIEKDDYAQFKKIMKEALDRANELKVTVKDRLFLEAIAGDNSKPGNLEKAQIDSGALNGEVPGDLYQTISCTAGFTFIRFGVDGAVSPCCVTPMEMGNMNIAKFDDIWHSDRYYAWREKFLQISTKHFHLKDREYGFCQMCPHAFINLESSQLLAIKRD